MTDSLTRTALLGFIDRYQRKHQLQFGTPAVVEYDVLWRSDCEDGDPDAHQRIRWKPVEQRDTSLTGLEQALDTRLHPSIADYYASVWFPGMGATSPDGDLELIGMWNADDFENLQANVIGHALQQRRANLPLTVFFAVTLPESEYCLAVDNETGHVVLERAGGRAERVISHHMSEFLDSLEPRFDNSGNV